MKKINVLFAFIVSFIAINIGISNINAEDTNGRYILPIEPVQNEVGGFDKIGKKATICAYCNTKECLYLVQNINSTDTKLTSSKDVKLFKKNGSSLVSVTLGESENHTDSGSAIHLNTNIPVYVDNTKKCSNYFYSINNENNSTIVEGYVATDDSIREYYSNKNETLPNKNIINYELKGYYGIDRFSPGYDDVSDPMILQSVEIVSNKIYVTDSNPVNPNPDIDISKLNQCISSHKNDKSCGYVDFIPSAIPFLTKLIMDLIKIVVPIILIIKGLIDLFKAMTASNEQEIAKARSKFFRRLTPALIVFLVILIVQLVFSLITSDNEKNSFLACADCFLNNDCQETSQEKITSYCQNLYSSTNQGGDNQGGNDSNIDYPTLPMSADEEQIRNHIVYIGRKAIQELNKDFVYLNPTQRDSTGCLSRFFNGDKCTTENKTSCSGNSCTYYGTDCNGFVAYVYHKALGITNGSNYRFAQPSDTNKNWELIGSASNYFESAGTVKNALNNIDKIEKAARQGDMLGRYCSGSDSHTHIGIYAGNGKVIENRGGTNPTCLAERSIKEYIRWTDVDCSVTILRLNNFDQSTYK